MWWSEGLPTRLWVGGWLLPHTPLFVSIEALLAHGEHNRWLAGVRAVDPPSVLEHHEYAAQWRGVAVAGAATEVPHLRTAHLRQRHHCGRARIHSPFGCPMLFFFFPLNILCFVC
jgi:hypothetical protein